MTDVCNYDVDVGAEPRFIGSESMIRNDKRQELKFPGLWGNGLIFVSSFIRQLATTYLALE